MLFLFVGALPAEVPLPDAFNPGHEAGLIFDWIALPYSEAESFHELPAPFRCVAVDLISGREIVLSDSTLGDALRATMAIPGVWYEGGDTFDDSPR